MSDTFLSILPEIHLVILPADRLVPGLEDALEAVAQLAEGCSNPFLVTGPSRTSDIEMEMVLGAHGPRAVHVQLVTDQDAAEEADVAPRDVQAILDGIPGALERAQLGLQQARTGQSAPL